MYNKKLTKEEQKKVLESIDHDDGSDTEFEMNDVKEALPVTWMDFNVPFNDEGILKY
jgi:hypothetical protein